MPMAFAAMYCSHRYENGQVVLPDISVEEMQAHPADVGGTAYSPGRGAGEALAGFSGAVLAGEGLGFAPRFAGSSSAFCAAMSCSLNPIRFIRSEVARGVAFAVSNRDSVSTLRCARSRSRAAAFASASALALASRSALVCARVAARDWESVSSARRRSSCSMRRAEPGRAKCLR